MKTKITYWKDPDGRYLGYLNSHLDHWTQDDDLADLKDHLRDLYDTFNLEDIPGDQKGSRPRNRVKRRDLIEQLESNGCVLLRHGAKHDIFHNPKTGRSPAIFCLTTLQDASMFCECQKRY